MSISIGTNCSILAAEEVELSSEDSAEGFIFSPVVIVMLPTLGMIREVGKFGTTLAGLDIRLLTLTDEAVLGVERLPSVFSGDDTLILPITLWG